MRTTVRLPDELLDHAKKRAADDGRTLTSMIEEGLRWVLTRQPAPPETLIRLPVSKLRGGVQHSVDINRSSDLEALMETALRTADDG